MIITKDPQVLFKKKYAKYYSIAQILYNLRRALPMGLIIEKGSIINYTS